MNDTNISFNYVSLSFVSKQEFKRQIRNTIIMKFVLDTFSNPKRLADHLEDTKYGYTDSAKEEGTHKFLRISDIKDGIVDWETVPYCNCGKDTSYILKANDLLIARTGGTTGKSFLINEIPYPSVYASYLIRLRTANDLHPNYLYLFLNSYIYWNQIVELKQGSAQPNVNAEKLKSLILPYCDISTQENLVTLAITGYCDRGLTELKNKINQFELKLELLEQLENLINDQRSFVQKLRHSILQEAIQGKLVPQDPTEETATVLLEQLKIEKENLIRKKKIKKERPLPPIAEDEVPFELPSGWKWVRLGEIGIWGSGATPNRGNPEFYNGSIPWLKTGELNDGYINISEEYITELALQNTSLRLNKPGDVLIAMYGATIGKLGILEIEATTNQACCACTPFNGIYNKFLFNYLLSQREQYRSLGAGGAQPNISKDKIVNSLFPLPPFSEQKRIVNKIDELMGICDKLEYSIEQSEQDSQRLMQSVLQEALNKSDYT